MKRKLSTENRSHFLLDNFRFTFRKFAAAIGLAVETEFFRAPDGEFESLLLLEVVGEEGGNCSIVRIVRIVRLFDCLGGREDHRAHLVGGDGEGGREG